MLTCGSWQCGCGSEYKVLPAAPQLQGRALRRLSLWLFFLALDAEGDAMASEYKVPACARCGHVHAVDPQTKARFPRNYCPSCSLMLCKACNPQRGNWCNGCRHYICNACAPRTSMEKCAICNAEDDVAGREVTRLPGESTNSYHGHLNADRDDV